MLKPVLDRDDRRDVRNKKARARPGRRRDRAVESDARMIVYRPCSTGNGVEIKKLVADR
jgi:hypothetical protein